MAETVAQAVAPPLHTGNGSRGTAAQIQFGTNSIAGVTGTTLTAAALGIPHPDFSLGLSPVGYTDIPQVSGGLEFHYVGPTNPPGCHARTYSDV